MNDFNEFRRFWKVSIDHDQTQLNCDFSHVWFNSVKKGDELMDGLDFFPESDSVWSIGQLGFEIQF